MMASRMSPEFAMQTTMNDPLPVLPRIEPDLFRAALGHYASGVNVITGICGEEPVGFTCQSFYSVSLDPPLVSFSVRKASKSWPKIRPSGHFTVNVLDWDQVQVSNRFAKSDGDRWSGIDWTPGVLGDPLIPGILMSIECRLHAEHDAGDHTVVLGRVIELSVSPEHEDRSPLVFFKGRYRRLAEA